MKEKIKKIAIHSFDIVVIITYIVIMMTMLSWLFESSSDWQSLRMGELFSNNELWFKVWIISLFYIPIRLLLKFTEKDSVT